LSKLWNWYIRWSPTYVLHIEPFLFLNLSSNQLFKREKRKRKDAFSLKTPLATIEVIDNFGWGRSLVWSIWFSVFGIQFFRVFIRVNRFINIPRKIQKVKRSQLRLLISKLYVYELDWIDFEVKIISIQSLWFFISSLILFSLNTHTITHKEVIVLAN